MVMTEEQEAQSRELDGTPLGVYLGQCEAYGAYIDELRSH